MSTDNSYALLRAPQSRFVSVRGLDYHAQVWGDPAMATPSQPALVLMHGWMDVGASFQFVVDALAAIEGPARYVVAPSWRGFGLTTTPPCDSYWFPDYVGDLDGLINAFSPDTPVDLLGHSMGGNVVMSYGGARPARIRRLINLEGFGLPAATPEEAPDRLVRWLDELQKPQLMRDYDSVAGVAARLQKNNPRLSADKAAWLAPHWSQQKADGRWHILGDSAHMRTNPVPYRAEEHLAQWRRIAAPLLWVEAEHSLVGRAWGARYSKAEFHERLNVVAKVQREKLADCGHMLHHDQPAALAALLQRFLSA